MTQTEQPDNPNEGCAAVIMIIAGLALIIYVIKVVLSV